MPVVDPGSTLARAIEVAARAHRDHLDKQGASYILHPLRIMLMVPEEAQVVAVLHDVIEDAGSDALGHLFNCLTGEEQEALDLLTRDKENENYAEYIERIATSGNRLAVMVKRADLMDNLRPWPNGSKSLRNRYRKALSRLTPSDAGS